MEKGDLNALSFGSVKFDIVYSSEVIEHVNNPITQFEQMFEIFNILFRHPEKIIYLCFEFDNHLIGILFCKLFSS